MSQVYQRHLIAIEKQNSRNRSRSVPLLSVLHLPAESACLFAMHLAGLWFGYWIRQDTLQLTHVALLLWTGIAFLSLNLIQ